MAFKKLDGCDSSDMGLWANGDCAKVFLREVEELRRKEIRNVVKAKCQNREESAAIVRSLDFVIGLFEEARELK